MNLLSSFAYFSIFDETDEQKAYILRRKWNCYPDNWVRESEMRRFMSSDTNQTIEVDSDEEKNKENIKRSKKIKRQLMECVEIISSDSEDSKERDENYEADSAEKNKIE